MIPLGYEETERSISANAMLCDGTPRREHGFRAHITFRMAQGMGWNYPAIVCVSPLLRTADEAKAWMPEVAA